MMPHKFIPPKRDSVEWLWLLCFLNLLLLTIRWNWKSNFPSTCCSFKVIFSTRTHNHVCKTFLFCFKNLSPPTLNFYFSTPAKPLNPSTAHSTPTYKIPSNNTNRRFFVRTSKRFKLHLNQLPSDALLLLLCKSGGGKKRFGYGAPLVALTFALEDEKHPVPTQPESTDDDVDAPLVMLFERDAFSFNDLVFPLVDGPWVVGCVGGGVPSSTIKSDFNS